MQTTSIRRAAPTLAAVSLLVLLTGCKASEKAVVDSVETSTWIKCAMGQSYVNESTDEKPTQFGAATEAWKDYYCANEDVGALWWSRLEVSARKYNGSTLCDTSSVVATTTQRSVSIQDSAVCASGGSSRIWVAGFHGAARSGSSTIHRTTSPTPEVTSY
ncbi:MAG TPA: hypothetical protein VNS19_11235 [Acidimicrobiales bacterium]|jgi:hypothetical protein|nr:hypothetical protein [Acidimicrobiales bacterium]